MWAKVLGFIEEDDIEWRTSIFLDKLVNHIVKLDHIGSVFE
jgi:hypothetical protein